MPSKRALYIGIDAYPRLHGRDLRGCVRDATEVRTLMAERFGFPADAPLLTDDQATRAEIFAAMAELVARTGPDDQVLVFYAGHGSRVATRSGDKVESLVPHDSGRGDDPNRDIFDFQFDQFVGQLNEKTPWVTLIMDCCHSGSVTRDIEGTLTREVPAETRSLEDLLDADALPGGGYLPTLRSAVVLAACRADELASEMQGARADEHHGAFTWHLLQTLSRLEGEVRWLDVMRSLTPALTAKFTRQHPVLEGASDRQVFGDDLPPRPRHFPVVQVKGDQCWIAGGQAHGVTVGSTWRFTPVGGGAPRELTVREVSALRARFDGADGVQVGWPAEPTEIALPTAQLAVHVAAESELADAVRRAIAAEEMLSLAQAADAADVRVVAVPARDGADGPLPQLGPLSEPVWAALGPDGRLTARLRPLRETTLLVQDLALVARFNGLLGLDFPDQSAPLREQITFELLDGPTGEPLSAQFGSGLPRVREGQKVEFEISNNSPEPLYVTLVEFGADREIKLLLPSFFGQVTDTRAAYDGGCLIEPGQRIRVAADYFTGHPDLPDCPDGAPLGLPDGFPWATEPNEPTPSGQMTLRLFASRAPESFRFLVQRATRGAGAQGLAQRLASFQYGKAGTRSFAVKPKVDRGAEDAGYAVFDRPIEVFRPDADTREIPPSTGGKVRFYKMVAGGQPLGEVGVTAPSMSLLPPLTSFWTTAPGAWPSAFELHHQEDVLEKTVDRSKRLVGLTRYTNPRFGKQARTVAAPAGMDASWRVSAGGAEVAFVARAHGRLHWFTAKARAWLPTGTLRFEKAALPTGAKAFGAIDKAL